MRLTTEKHAAHAKMSAETMSMFTIVTTIFLPLTFFTSVSTPELAFLPPSPSYSRPS